MSRPPQRPRTVLDFEKPILELELRVEKLRALADNDPDVASTLGELEKQVERLRRETFARLTRWQVVQLARHPGRPSPLDYMEALVPDFVELHGDRATGDDPAIIGGLGTVAGHACVVLAHARGRDEQEQQERLFGMPRPAGFRKAARLATTASQLGLPILTFVDTPGAWPGADAEEQGQAMAIAACLEAFASVRTPVVACVVGEGGSGGALALALSDALLMQEYATFAVISPEACSSILYRDGSHAEETAESLRLTAPDLVSLQLVDELVPEPAGGAHRNVAEAASLLGEAVARQLDALVALPEDVRLAARWRRLKAYGAPALQ